MPSVMPEESHKKINNIPMPDEWILAIDGTPDRSMTLGCRKWWDRYGEWVMANKSKLGITSARLENWRTKAMAQAVVIDEDEGKDDWDFVCLPEKKKHDPEDDWEDIDEDDEDDEGDKDEDEDDKDGDDKDKDEDGKDGDNPDKKNIADKLASLHPDCHRIVSMRGRDRWQWWILETLKRDQDCFSMHIYNDYSLYGQLEVLANIADNFDDVYQNDPALRYIWPEVEGLALLVDSGFIDLNMIDGPDTAGDLIELIGKMVVVAIEYIDKNIAPLQQAGLPNVGFILSRLVKWAWELQDAFDKNAIWVHRIIERTEEGRIELPEIEDIVKKLKDEGAFPAQLKKWRDVNWATEFRSFHAIHGDLSGNKYDIMTMRPAERKSHSFGSSGGWIF